MKMSASDISILKKLLIEEIEVYSEYIGLLKLEKKSLVSYQVSEINTITQKRSALHELMKKHQEARLLLMQKYPEFAAGCNTLTMLVKKICHPKEAKEILKLVKKLQSIVKKTQSRGSEFTGVLSFTTA
ncbi:MAG: flagellar export chaperone FlgN, partial [Bdellovibrionales bacterium]|nr:flagellar export chaperone FlgN [Bdellovibrionales bacterium]